MATTNKAFLVRNGLINNWWALLPVQAFAKLLAIYPLYKSLPTNA
jgi:hypothetical protein